MATNFADGPPDDDTAASWGYEQPKSLTKSYGATLDTENQRWRLPQRGGGHTPTGPIVEPDPWLRDHPHWNSPSKSPQGLDVFGEGYLDLVPASHTDAAIDGDLELRGSTATAQVADSKREPAERLSLEAPPQFPAPHADTAPQQSHVDDEETAFLVREFGAAAPEESAPRPFQRKTICESCVGPWVVLRILGTAAAMALGFLGSFRGFAVLLLVSLAAIPGLESFLLPLEDPKRKNGSPQIAVTITALFLLFFDSSEGGLATLVVVMLISLALTAGNDLLQDLHAQGS